MSSMLEFPTFEEMVRVMNSPSAPPSPIDHAEYLNSQEAAMEMSTDEMIAEMYVMMKKEHRDELTTDDSGATRGSLDVGAILMGNPAQP